MKGYVHSLQSMGAVDGPGLRYVVFLQGCPLRCMYCHNPDSWQPGVGTEYEVSELVTKILRYRPYFGSLGGVTVSGGEALLQAEFVTELFAELHKHGIHTCLDTSGIGGGSHVDALLEVTDLVMCDIKFSSEGTYRRHTGGSLDTVLHFLEATERHNTDLWVRHVVVPGHTDTPEEIDRMLALATRYSNLRKVELLPFHKLCVPKYEKLGIPFPCADIPPCDKATIEALTLRIPEQYR